MAYAHVWQRFATLQANLALTPNQMKDGIAKFEGITACLNRVYRNHSSTSANAFLIGSWAKETCIRPPRDVDMYYVLPEEVYFRYQKYAPGVNKQTALLQEVKRKLLEFYSRSEIKGDGPVVLADFSGWTVEIVPSFLFSAINNTYYVCDTKNGGRYQTTTPFFELSHLSASDSSSNGNTRALVRMLKCWQSHCNVPIKSYLLELLAVQFIATWQYKERSSAFHDYMIRDFLEWLLYTASSFVITPGNFEILWLDGAWRSRAEAAYLRAKKAVEYEAADYMYLAGEEWQKIFGNFIPMSV